jgi:hypothetical protein
MLKILLTNNHLYRRGGSETFTYALAEEFARRGHAVSIFTIEPGVLSLQIPATVVEEPKGDYDLILVSHNTCLPRVSRCGGPKVLTCHGIFPSPEQPTKGADHYVGISEEVCTHLSRKGYPSTLIRNGINCREFASLHPIRQKLKSVLCLAQSDKARSKVYLACKKLGLELAMGDNEPNVVQWMNRADIVVSLGRGAYEAMACGRAVLIFDERWYMPNPGVGDGLVTRDNWKKLAECNFSGRATGKVFEVEDLEKEFSRYEPSMGTVNREIAVENFNVEGQVDKYLALVGIRE